MTEALKGESNYVGYEYRNMTVNRGIASLVCDGCESFGWQLEGAYTPIGQVGRLTLKLKRDRKIRNKTELTRLQRQFESCVSEIEALKRAKITTAAAFAYVIGCAGTAMMAGAVFAYLAGMLPLCIILAVPAFAGWILPYFVFTKIRGKKTSELNPVIDSKLDEIYDVCEKACALAS